MSDRELIITTAITIFKELAGTMEFPRNLDGFKKAVAIAKDIIKSVSELEASSGN